MVKSQSAYPSSHYSALSTSSAYPSQSKKSKTSPCAPCAPPSCPVKCNPCDVPVYKTGQCCVPTKYVKVPGPKGATGPPGQDGKSGATGPTGPQGQAGLPGDNGGQGFTGPTGDQGFTGPTGAVGETGFTGPPGTEATPVFGSTTYSSEIFEIPLIITIPMPAQGVDNEVVQVTPLVVASGSSLKTALGIGVTATFGQLEIVTGGTYSLTYAYSGGWTPDGSTFNNPLDLVQIQTGIAINGFLGSTQYASLSPTSANIATSSELYIILSPGDIITFEHVWVTANYVGTAPTVSPYSIYNVSMTATLIE